MHEEQSTSFEKAKVPNLAQAANLDKLVAVTRGKAHHSFNMCPLALHGSPKYTAATSLGELGSTNKHRRGVNVLRRDVGCAKSGPGSQFGAVCPFTY